LPVLALVAALVLGAVAPAHAQQAPPSRQEILTHYSLYFENYKADNWEAALPDLRWMLENAPTEPKNDDRNYERIVKVHAALAEAAEGDARTAHLDTAWTYLNRAVEELEAAGAEVDPFEWTVKKGTFLEQHAEGLPGHSTGEAIDYYEEAYEMAPDRLHPYYVNKIVQSYLEAGEQQRALEMADMLEEQRSDDEAVMNIVDQVRDDIFGKDPEAQLEYLRTQVEQHPDDPALKRQLFEAYMDLDYREEASELANDLLEDEPSLETSRMVARLRLEDGRAAEAFEILQTAQESGAALTHEDFYNMGRAKYQLDQLQSARSYYRKALDLKSDYGRALIAIGDVYAKAVANCGGAAMERNDKAVYWLVVDYYQRAKRTDASVASLANSKIGTYTQYFPSQEDIFYRSDWSKGSSYVVNEGCYSWIGEATTVRAQ
jgi:tetratricopeptide (TPR) repeat protein